MSIFKKLTRFRAMPQQLLSTVGILSDVRVPMWKKILFLGVSLGYFIMPFDFMLDVPFVGFLDDVGIFLLLYYWFMSRIDDNIKADHGWKDQ